MTSEHSGRTTLQQVTARRVLMGLMGIAGTRGILWTLLLLIALAMVADAVDRTLKRLMNVALDMHGAAFWNDGVRQVGYDLALMAFVAVGLLALVRSARRATRRMHLDAESSAGPPPAEVLVLMLSQAKSLDGIENVTSINDPALQSHNWLMPAIAINHHRLRLRRVIVLASRGGSASQIEPFAALARQITNNVNLKIQTPTAYLADSKLLQTVEHGVDMENMPEMVEALDETFRALIDNQRSDRVSERDIMFDVTSGTKIGTSAMITVALAYDVRWQYCLSAGDAKRVTSYRPRFAPAEK